MKLTRQERIALLEALEQRVRQFRRDDDIWPFRRPSEPLDFSRLVTFTLGHPSTASAVVALRSRTVIEMQWPEGGRWEAWAVTLPSGIHVYLDTDDAEHRLLASVKRGSAIEADRFFLELLAESRGRHFGIEMSGGAPTRVRTGIGDRTLITDVMVDLFEGTEAEAGVRGLVDVGSADFRVCVDAWLASVLIAPVDAARTRRYTRLREL